MFSAFFHQLDDVWRSDTTGLRSYLKREKGLCLFTLIIIFLFYGLRLTHNDIFVDSDILLVNPEELIYSWYGSQRFGLIFTKKLFGLVRLTPFLSNALMVLGLWALTIGICYVIWLWCGMQPWIAPSGYLFSILFLSAPCFAEQFNFLLQAFENVIAMIACLLGIFSACQWIYYKKSFLWTLPAIFFAGWAFASYQAYPAFYIALAAISYLCFHLFQEQTYSFVAAVKHMALFLISFTASQLCAVALRILKQGDNAYISGKFFWQTEPLETCLEYIQLDIDRLYRSAWPTFFSKWFLPLILICSALVLIYAIRRKQKNLACLIAALVILPLSPLLITLVTGGPQQVRSQMTYPLVFAFYVSFLYIMVRKYLAEAKTDRLTRTWKQGICIVLASAGLFTGWRQGVIMNQLWETAHESYLYDVLTANRMYSDICRVADNASMNTVTLVFVGSRPSNIPGNPQRGDAIGMSIFEWDAAGYMGVNPRICTFFVTLGMSLQMPSHEDYTAAIEASAEHPAWPATDSIFQLRDNVIVIKLSE